MYVYVLCVCSCITYPILHYVHTGDCYGQNSTIDSTDIQGLEQSITQTHGQQIHENLFSTSYQS